jgi:hypothetical protein
LSLHLVLWQKQMAAGCALFDSSPYFPAPREISVFDSGISTFPKTSTGCESLTFAQLLATMRVLHPKIFLHPTPNRTDEGRGLAQVQGLSETRGE